MREPGTYDAPTISTPIAATRWGIIGIGGGVFASTPIRDGDRGLFYGVLTSCKLFENVPTHVAGPVDNGGGNVQPDLNASGVVTKTDLELLLDAWGNR